MGCTEPIAVAYAAALARKTLGVLPEGVDIRVSANIIKNVKSVVVPHTGGLRRCLPRQRPQFPAVRRCGEPPRSSHF